MDSSDAEAAELGAKLGGGCGLAASSPLDGCTLDDGLPAVLGSTGATGGAVVGASLEVGRADEIGDVEGAVVAAASDSMCRLQPWKATASARAATGQVHCTFIDRR
jgi:hypothetical protein